MTKRSSLAVDDLKVSPFTVLGKDWMLLTAGSFKEASFNTMTVGWGALGTMWNKPFVMVVVRPGRYTYEFTEKFDSFTLTAFSADLQDKLKYLGSHSGRDSDKIAESDLTPEASTVVDAPTFAEAELAMECRKIYFDDFNPENFLADYIAKQYNNDFHRMYFGEIIALSATEKYT